MQQSNNFNPRKRCIKKLWKGYDESNPYWKDDQLRGMATEIIKTEIDSQIDDYLDEVEDSQQYNLDNDIC